MKTNITIDGERIVVRNPWTITEIPLTAVSRVVTGRRLTLHLHDGTVVRPWAVQRTTVSWKQFALISLAAATAGLLGWLIMP